MGQRVLRNSSTSNHTHTHTHTLTHKQTDTAQTDKREMKDNCGNWINLAELMKDKLEPKNETNETPCHRRDKKKKRRKKRC